MKIDEINIIILEQISKIANSTLDLRERLNAITSIMVKNLKKDACAIFVLDDITSELNFIAGYGLSHRDFEGEGVISSKCGCLGKVIREGTPLVISDILENQHTKYHIENVFKKFKTFLAVPIFMEDKLKGIMTLHSFGPTAYFSEDITLLITISNEIASIIKTSLLFDSLRQRIKHLEVINKISSALVSTLNQEKLLQMIVENCLELTNANGAVLRLHDKKSGKWITKAYCGNDEPFCELITSEEIDDSYKQVSRTRTAILKKSVKNSDLLTTILCVPLLSKNELLGTITLFNKKISRKNSFTEDDKQLISTIADQAAIAVENAMIYGKLERLAEENRKRLLRITILYEISLAMKATLDLNMIIDIVLTGITMGGGLGFQRAMLFLVNKIDNTLDGRAGIEPPGSPELYAKPPEGQKDKQSSEKTYIAKRIHSRKSIETDFNKAIALVKIPINEKEGRILAKTVLQNNTFVSADINELPEPLRCFYKEGEPGEFMIVPLTTENSIIGVIAVDNKLTKKKITEEDLEFVKMLANQSALAIESAVIHSKLENAMDELKNAQEKLIQSEKLAALGEMSSAIAHEIRNPLISISGFANRIRKKLPDDPEIKKYGEIVFAEANKLEKLLEEILVYSRDAMLNIFETDINHLIQSLIQENMEIFNSKSIILKTTFDGNLPLIRADRYQLRQVFVNLFSNAEHALEEEGGGTLSVKTATNKDDKEIVISVANTGACIPSDVISNIFNPFFTTKQRGTGLGLAIVHRIISLHKGSIAVENLGRRGVKFTITLPVNT